MHQTLYDFYCTIKKWSELSQQTNFLSHFERFIVYALLRPTSYATSFFHNKGLMKFHNRGKFNKYSICGCQVASFQRFSYRFSIHEMALSWGKGGGV